MCSHGVLRSRHPDLPVVGPFFCLRNQPAVFARFFFLVFGFCPQAEGYDLKVKGEENTMDYRAFFNQASRLVPQRCRSMPEVSS